MEHIYSMFLGFNGRQVDTGLKYWPKIAFWLTFQTHNAVACGTQLRY